MERENNGCGGGMGRLVGLSASVVRFYAPRRARVSNVYELAAFEIRCFVRSAVAINPNDAFRVDVPPPTLSTSFNHESIEALCD
ncbi:hypothetical protein Trydic_g4018 [Trypoxylus dichotomus]